MTTYDEVDATLLEQIALLARAASGSIGKSSGTALNYAAAAAQLAEARAWLSDPDQPHGGTAVTESR